MKPTLSNTVSTKIHLMQEGRPLVSLSSLCPNCRSHHIASIIIVALAAITIGYSQEKGKTLPDKSVNTESSKVTAPVVADPSEKFSDKISSWLQMAIAQEGRTNVVCIQLGEVGDIFDLKFAPQDGNQITFTTKFKFVKKGVPDRSYKGRYFWNGELWALEMQQVQ